MAISRSRVVAPVFQTLAWATGQRPVVLERRLRREVRADAAGEHFSPAQAWEVYGRSMKCRCFSTNGWLVQFGVYAFDGPGRFQFSLVRQFESLQSWNDEYVQLDLIVHHEPTDALRRLGRWSTWSFEDSSLSAFRERCQRHELVREILADTSRQWRWEILCEET